MKKLLLLMAVLLLAASVQAQTISETTLQDKGLQGLIIEGESQEKCLDIAFLNREEFQDRQNTIIFSLHTEMLPSAQGEALISIYLNSETMAELRPYQLPGGWYRLRLPQNKLKEENLLQVCGKTSNTITLIKLLNDSKIGAYKTADLYRADSFTKTVSSDVPEINKPFKVYITVRNYGFEPVEVKVDYWVVEMEKVELVGGQTEFSGQVPAFNYDANTPGEKVFSYRVFPEHALQMTLPAATLEYTNNFGEKVLLRSTRPMIFVDEPDYKVDGLLSFRQALYPVNQAVPGKLIVKNNSQQAVQNIVVYLVSEEGLQLSKAQETITQLGPKETREIEFTATASEPGKLEVGCSIVYTDTEVVQFTCAKDYLFYEEEKFNAVLVFGAILAGLAVLIYLFIYYKE